MATRTETTQMNALVTMYLKMYNERYKRAPDNFNRHRDKWGFKDMIDDLGYQRSQDVIKYYFETNNILHPVSTLLYNYDMLYKIMVEKEQDAEKRAELLKESEARVKAWRETHGDKSG